MINGGLVQNLEYKFVELLSCQLRKGSEEATKSKVSQRFNHLRQRNNLLQTRLEDVLGLVSHHLVPQPSCILWKT